MSRNEAKVVIVAGVVAGILSTVAQISLWLLSGTPVMETLLRDARMTSALVSGVLIIDSPVAWSVVVMSATIIHFALSIGFSFAIVAITAHLAPSRAALGGGIAGLALYAINLYGLTAIFPWFIAARDWTTVAAHIVFGTSAALTYALCRGRA